MNIESDIPIPVSGKCRSATVDAARALEVGQSVLCDTVSQRDVMRSTLRNLGRAYTSRKVDDGWRVWRIE